MEAVEGEDEFWLGWCSAGCLRWCRRLHDDGSERGDWEDDFCFPVRAHEIPGVAQAGGVVAHTVCKEKRGNYKYFVICLTKSEVSLPRRARKVDFLRKLKSIHEATKCFVDAFLPLEVHKQSSQVQW